MLRAVLLAGTGIPCVSGQLLAAPFQKYPNYTGNLSGVAGTIQLGQDGDNAQIMFFNLTKVDLMCNSTANVSGVKNACGIHVHEGTSCADAKDHYWSKNFTSKDPWAAVRYTVGGSGNTAVGQNVRVATGKTLADMKGRAFVVHDATGKRIACSLLSSVALTSGHKLTVSKFAKYPGYTGSLTVAGQIHVDASGTGAEASQVLTFNLTGIDSTCGTANISGVDNACGIHVHDGSDCGNASTIGGHYYNKNKISLDPWKPIMYTANGSNAMGITIKVVTGVTNKEVAGRSLVVHNASGARIACGVIPSWSASIDSAHSVSLTLPLLLALLATFIF